MLMELPTPVAQVLEALEQAGFAAYAVGGCVRDAILGIPPKDYDLCTEALPEQTAEIFKSRNPDLTGGRHGTVRVPTDWGTVEVTTFRTEGTYSDSRHPDFVKFVPEVQEDLRRRDFTVNAMAWSPSRGLADPFGGREDLQDGILRTVGDPAVRFREDALRVLRGLRFAVRFQFRVEEKTFAAMTSQSLEGISGQRILEELSEALPRMDCKDLKTFAPILAKVIPELGPMVDFDQHSPHHKYDLYTHTALVTEQVPRDLTLRWAALLHDIGKVPTFTRDKNGRGHFYGHAPAGARMARRVLDRLQAPKALREQAVTLIGEHMTRLEEDPGQLKRRIRRLGWETADKLWYLQRADLMSKGTDTPEDRAYFQRIRREMDRIHGENACLEISQLAVSGRDLQKLGYSGRAVGQCLEALLELVMDEKIPNRRQTLLEKAEALKNTI